MNRLISFAACRLLLPLVILAAAGCGQEQVPDDVVQDADVLTGDTSNPDTFSIDDTVRLNQIQFKGTHNSYKIATDYCPPEWCLTMPPLDEQLQDLGVRSVELDVHMTADGTLDVFHLAFMDPLTTCQKFKDCLGLVKTWSDNHPGHLPIFILVEPKDDQDEESLTLLGKLAVIENEILAVFDRDEIITPDAVRGAHATLNEAITTDGWPLLRDCRDRVIFVMLDNDKHLREDLVLHPNLAGAIIFPRNGKGESWSSFLEVSPPSTEEAGAELMSAVQENYMVRVTVDSPDMPKSQHETIAAITLDAGVQLVDTDHPSESTTPAVDGETYRFDIPGGTIARCNPVNAPTGCVSEDLESITP